MIDVDELSKLVPCRAAGNVSRVELLKSLMDGRVYTMLSGSKNSSIRTLLKPRNTVHLFELRHNLPIEEFKTRLDAVERMSRLEELFDCLGYDKKKKINTEALFCNLSASRKYDNMPIVGEVMRIFNNIEYSFMIAFRGNI